MTMSTGTLRVGILAILAGLIGAYVIQQVLTTKPVALAPAPRVLQVPIASSTLPPGRVIAMGDISLVNMSNEQLAAKGIPLETIMMDPAQIVGRRLRNSLSLNGLFTTTDMYLQYGGINLAEKLKPGYRAFSLSMPTSVGSRFQPEMMVDVMFRTTPRPAKDDVLGIPEMTVTLAQGLEVINVELPPPPPPGGNDPGPRTLDLRNRSNMTQAAPPTVVTLAVTPDQSKVLQTAMGRGELMLSPWSVEDTVFPPAGKKGLTLEEILGIEAPPPVVITPPFITEVYRRGAADIRGYRRDMIHSFDSKRAPRPGDLPNPNAIPAPAPKPMPMDK